MTEKSRLFVEGKISLFRNNIYNETVCLCLQGKSIEELEKRIHEFQGLPMRWAGQNRYDCIQTNILNKINAKMNVVMDVGTVRNEDEYDEYIRIPRIEQILRINPEISVLSTHKVFTNLKDVKPLMAVNPAFNFVFIDIDNSNLFIPNSLTVYLLLLAQYGAKQIILFGLDGFGNPKAFQDKVPSVELMSADGYNSKMDVETYYMPDIVRRDRQIGFGNSNMSYLFSDSPPFNAHFQEVYEKYCADYQFEPVKIWNCSPNSKFTVFEKINYSRAIELCRL